MPRQRKTLEEKRKTKREYMHMKEWYCEICNERERNYTMGGKIQHEKTCKHVIREIRQKINQDELDNWYCPSCDVISSIFNDKFNHVQTEKHIENYTNNNEKPPSVSSLVDLARHRINKIIYGNDCAFEY